LIEDRDLLAGSRSGHWYNRHSVCIIHTMQSRALIKLLQTDGWQLQRTRGSHHQFVHPTKPGTDHGATPKEGLGQRPGAGDSQAGWFEVRNGIYALSHSYRSG